MEHTSRLSDSAPASSADKPSPEREQPAEDDAAVRQRIAEVISAARRSANAKGNA